MIDSPARDTLFAWPMVPQDSGERGRLCVLGAPTDQGNAISRGTAHGPQAIRRASLSVRMPSTRGYDCGDIERGPASDPTAYLQRVAEAAAAVFERQQCPLMLGGDHSITYAPVSVLQQRQDICLIWFDAHTDFSPWSGPAAHDHKQVLRRITKLSGVRRIVQIGYRGITVGDERQLGERNAVVTSAQARSLDAQALLALVPADLPCYLSIDIDAIDPLWAPGTSAPVPDGLLPEEVRALLVALVRHRRIAGVDLVEVNPNLDTHSQTSEVAAQLIHAIAQEWTHQLASPQPEDGEPPSRADVQDTPFAQHACL